MRVQEGNWTYTYKARSTKDIPEEVISDNSKLLVFWVKNFSELYASKIFVSLYALDKIERLPTLLEFDV